MTAIIEVISAFWLTMDSGIQRYITSLAATLTADLLKSLGKKKGDEFEDALQDAYLEGLKHFLYTLHDERIDKEHICSLFNDKDIRSLLVKSATKTPSIGETARITETMARLGIDILTIRHLSASQALLAFQRGFLSQAELSDKLIPFLGLQYLKELAEGHRPPPPDLATMRSKYFIYLKEKYGALSFRGLSEGKTVSFLLKDLYTNLSFSKEQTAIDGSSPLCQKKELTQALDLESSAQGVITPSVILASGHAVITGGPGSGKSTLLKYIAISFVDGAEETRLAVKDKLLPILLPIAAYAEGLRKGTTPGLSLAGFIPAYYISKNLPDLVPLFEDARERGQALYLLDGLDEVSDEAERRRVAAAVKDLIVADTDTNGHQRANRYLITCRTASYTRAVRFDLTDRHFLHYAVLPFDRKHTQAFLFNWYCCYEREINLRITTCDAEARVKSEQMMAAIDEDQNLADLATNPLMLTMLGLIEHEGGKLPDNRAELYAKCLCMFSGLWDSLRSLHQRERQECHLSGYKIDEDFIVNYLGPVAFALHESAQPEIEAGELKKELAERFMSREKDSLRSKQLSEELLGILKQESGILRETGIGTFSFVHQTFREYLSARVLTDLEEGSDRLARLGARIFKPEWQEVVLLTAATLKHKAASQFIRGIYERPANHQRNLLLAGKCACDSGRERVDDALYDELITSMMSVIEGSDHPRVRAAIGETLGWLGDPRDLKEFISVAGGVYNLSIGKVTLAAFELSRFPVTNGWFAEFIAADGYSTKSYWGEEGLQWLEKKRKIRPKYWNDRKWRCPNAPVVGVSWYEAVAFTKWLKKTRNDSYQYCLPSEAEWEAAAAGQAGRVYPWGDESYAGRCNTVETRFGQTSAAGIFAAGDSPGTKGISDMSGNVWEWVACWHGENTVLKVLRGGSWSLPHGFARCAFHNMYDPNFRNDNIGFRCARSKMLSNPTMPKALAAKL